MPTAALPSDQISSPDLPGLAREHHGQNRLKEAAECYGEMLRANPRSQTALLGLSLIARQSNQLPAALDMAQAAVDCSPVGSRSSALATAHLGHCLLALRKLEQAQAAFERVLAWVDEQRIEGRGKGSDAALEQTRLEAGFEESVQAGIQSHVGLGELFSSTGRHREAIPHFRAAIELQPDLAAAHFGLGSALSVTSKSLVGCEAALASFKRAAVLAPGSPEAHFGVAFLESRLGRHGDAVRGYRMAVKCRPTFASAWLNLGVELIADGHEEFAESCYREAISVLPSDTSQFLNARKPAHAGTEISAWLNLGHLFRGRRDFTSALRDYHKALAIAQEHRADPGLRERLQEVHIAFTYLFMEKGDFERAWSSMEAAEAAEAAEEPNGTGNARNPEIPNARGILILAEEYLRLRPSQLADVDWKEPHREAQNHNLTVSFVSRIEKAIEAFQEAEALGHLTAASNRGNALLRIGRCEEGLAAHEAACRTSPLNPGVRYNLALTQLRMGNYLDGWANYEVRWSFREVHPRPRHFLAPRWQGADELNPGNGVRPQVKLLLYAEQGLGDSLQFLRFLPLVVQALLGSEQNPPVTALLILEVQAPLIRLLTPHVEHLESLNPNLRTCLVCFGEPLPKFTHHCPLLSLAALFKITPETIPFPPGGKSGYLDPDYELVRRRAAQIADLEPSDTGRLKVGLAWAGNPGYRADYERSTCLKTFVPLLELDSIRYFSLQKGQAKEQIAELPERLRPLDGCSNDQDLADTAALISNLDLVITTDTSIAHLAGALGKPLWLLLPWQSDWRWMQDVPITPWYPTARLFRQSAPNDWAELLSRVAEQLAGFSMLRTGIISTPRVPLLQVLPAWS